MLRASALSVSPDGAAIPLAIEVAAQPDDTNEPIPCKAMVAKDKLLAEGSLSETKVILGWLFNFRILIVFLPDQKSVLPKEQELIPEY